MSRTLPRVGILLLAVAAAATIGFLSSFFAVREGFAHGNHCGVGSNPVCNDGPGGPAPDRYYAGQVGEVDPGQPGCCFFKHGIKGQIVISSEPTLLLPPSGGQQDFIADWLGITSSYFLYNFMQMGFWHGSWNIITGQVLAHPTRYYEHYDTAGCQPDGKWTLSGSNSAVLVEMRALNQSTTCGGTTMYKYQMVVDGATLVKYAWMPANLARPDANMEVYDKVHMQPGGGKCYGTTTSCNFNTTAFALQVHDGVAWSVWPNTPVQSSSDAGYQWVPANQYKNFIVVSQW